MLRMQNQSVNDLRKRLDNHEDLLMTIGPLTKRLQTFVTKQNSSIKVEDQSVPKNLTNEKLNEIKQITEPTVT